MSPLIGCIERANCDLGCRSQGIMSRHDRQQLTGFVGQLGPFRIDGVR